MEKYIIIQKKKNRFIRFLLCFNWWNFCELFVLQILILLDLVYTRTQSFLDLVTIVSLSVCSYLSVFPFVWLFLYDVIAMFAMERSLNEFVEHSKAKSFRCHYKAYYTNLFAATDVIMITVYIYIYSRKVQRLIRFRNVRQQCTERLALYQFVEVLMVINIFAIGKVQLIVSSSCRRTQECVW